MHADEETEAETRRPSPQANAGEAELLAHLPYKVHDAEDRPGQVPCELQHLPGGSLRLRAAVSPATLHQDGTGPTACKVGMACG